jgi:DNA-binding response OmpR family regulator
MSGRLLIVREGLNGAVPWIAQALRDAGLTVEVVTSPELATCKPADAVLMRLPSNNAAQACWAIRRQGHRSIVAVSAAASSAECIRLLNAGADYYLDAWLPPAELVARVRVALRFVHWLDAHESLVGAVS